MAHALEIAGVEKLDSGIQGGVDGRHAFGFVGRPVKIGHAHTSQADARDDRPGGPEGTRRDRGL